MGEEDVVRCPGCSSAKIVRIQHGSDGSHTVKLVNPSRWYQREAADYDCDIDIYRCCSCGFCWGPAQSARQGVGGS